MSLWEPDRCKDTVLICATQLSRCQNHSPHVLLILSSPNHVCRSGAACSAHPPNFIPCTVARISSHKETGIVWCCVYIHLQQKNSFPLATKQYSGWRYLNEYLMDAPNLGRIFLDNRVWFFLWHRNYFPARNTIWHISSVTSLMWLSWGLLFNREQEGRPYP